MDDPELVAAAKSYVGQQHGLSEQQSRRLQGDTLRELHTDAVLMAKELGLVVDDRARDESGRFATAGRSMNEQIRSAAGR